MQWLKNEPMARQRSCTSLWRWSSPEPARMGGAIWLYKRAFCHRISDQYSFSNDDLPFADPQDLSTRRWHASLRIEAAFFSCASRCSRPLFEPPSAFSAGPSSASLSVLPGSPRRAHEVVARSLFGSLSQYLFCCTLLSGKRSRKRLREDASPRRSSGCASLPTDCHWMENEGRSPLQAMQNDVCPHWTSIFLRQDLIPQPADSCAAQQTWLYELLRLQHRPSGGQWPT